MPNARIPSLATWGLDVVPGHTLDKSGKEDPLWRERYRHWHAEMREWRVEQQAEWLRDEQYRNTLNALCDKDTAFFINLWLEVEEPRAMAETSGDGEIVNINNLDLADLSDFDTSLDYKKIHPFIMRAYQVQGVQVFDHLVLNPKFRTRQLNAVWDKARGVGFTYAMLAAAYKNWLYRTGIRGTILTEKWDKADRTHSLNTLFGKLDLFFDSTPDDLIPPGFRSRGEKDAHRLKGTLKNPKNGSIIDTEPTTMSSTRSGRAAYVMIDEGAFQEYLTELWATAIGTTNHILAWSTASWQMGQQWQTVVDEARKDTTGSVILTEIDYWENPYQDAAWERKTRAIFEAAGIKEQFEVEYLRNAGAGSGTLVYKTLVDRCPDTDLWYDPTRPVYASCDPGIDDATAWDFWQNFIVDGKKVIRWIDSYERDKMPVEFHAHLITGIPPIPGDAAYPLWAEGFYGDVELYFMDWLRGVSPSMIEYYGDPAILIRDYSHESFAKKLNFLTSELREREGIDSTPVYPLGASWKPLYKRNNFNERRQAGRKVLMHSEFSTTEGAQLLKIALGRTRFQEVTEKATRAPGHVHDRYSHRVSAFEFGSIWETLELTPDELAPAKPLKARGVRPSRTVHSIAQRQHKSLVGVA